ncbi:MAG TPA: GNAT family N-acetyltransferase [Candidatus Saccharimonadia bacterium]|nr:GNAT family N-acetyltransferase [Candidatus Saccharimonadia bacterium]
MVEVLGLRYFEKRLLTGIIELMYIIRSGQAKDAVFLSDLAFRSKAYWGYDKEFMARFKSDLKMEPADCASGLTRIAFHGDAIVGFYSLYGDAPEGKLTDLFVEPSYIGKGVGKELWGGAIRQAKELGFTTLEIHSDPHAEGFYLRMGAERKGSVPSSSIAERKLPFLIMRIK